MTTKQKDGGPAFPAALGTGLDGQGGMTLRDYFAGHATAGMLAECGSDTDDDILARRAYEIADALLEARGKAPGPFA